VHVKEFANLKELRGCLSDHKHIMVNIATIVETSDYRKYHLLYELAAYDLGVFLTTPRLEVRSKRRGSARQNRNGSSDVQAADLIEAISNLADALDYIHNRLYTREGRIALAHNDIKPDNILVVYPDSTDPSHVFPAGKWKLTDFGLSRIKERKCNEQRLGANDAIQRPDMTQMTHRLQSSVSKTQPKRDPGNYTAPELEQNRDQPQKVDGRKADIWSFGCVLADVIAYAVQMDNSLVSDLHLTAGIRYYTNDGKKIKPDILEFFKQLPEKAPEWARELNSHAWIRSCTDLVEKILDMKPTERPGANKIRDGLRDIRGDAKAYEGPWTDVGEHRSASPEPTNPMHLDGHNCGARRAAEDTAQPPQIIVSPVGHSASFQNGRRSERTRDDFEL
jgi:serine/threonine protein kinase